MALSIIRQECLISGPDICSQLCLNHLLCGLQKDLVGQIWESRAPGFAWLFHSPPLPMETAGGQGPAQDFQVRTQPQAEGLAWPCLSLPSRWAGAS